MKKMNARMRYLAKQTTARVWATVDVNALLTQAQTLAADIKALRAQLADKVGADGAKAADGKALYDQIAEKKALYDQTMEAAQTEMQAQANRVAAGFNHKLESVAQHNAEALGSLYRALITGAAIPQATISALSLPTVTTGGAAGNGGYLLPKNVSDQIIRDIVDDDSILAEITTTSITGLEMPKVTTTDVDGDDVADGTDAPDATLTASMLTFGRLPYAKAVTVPNSLLTDTNTAIESYIDTRHAEMMRARLCKRILAKGATGNYTHMSVYDSSVGVKTTTSNTDLLDGIMTALSELPTRPQGVYKVALKMSDWMGMIKTLANGAVALFSDPTRQIIGFTPVISSYVDKPIVGNLKTIHLNFDSPIAYETERHAKARTTDFVLSTYYDIQIEQPELLRIVDVQAA